MNPTINRPFKSTAIVCLSWFAFLQAILFVPSLAQAATGADTWVGNTSANFGDANWLGANNPPLSGDSWIFGLAGTAGPNLNNNLPALNSVAGITFKGGASAFTLTNNSITLTGDVLNNSTNLQMINFPIGSTAARTFTTTAGGGNLVLGGVFSGIGGGITKVGPGTLTLNGTAVNTYSGPTTITGGGSLIEDFTNAVSAVNLIDSSSSLVLGGGALQIKQKNATPTSQSFASTTVNPGFTTITGTSNGSGGLTIALGAITHNVGGTVDFTNALGGAITTTTANVNGILGGWATTGDAISSTTTGGWAANDGSGNIVPYTGYTAVSASASSTPTITGAESTQNWLSGALNGNNYITTLNTSATINSLVQQGDFGINSGVTLTLGSGGLMMKGNSRWMLNNGAGNRTGSGQLTSGLPTGELYLHAPNPAATDWRIWPMIVDGSSGPLQLIKDGPGTVSLQNTNTYSGGTVVNGGTLQLYTGGVMGAIRGTVTVNPGAALVCTNVSGQSGVNAFGYGVNVRITNAIVNGGTLNTVASGDQSFNCTFNLTGGTMTSFGGTNSPSAPSYWLLCQDTAANGGAHGINTFPSAAASVIMGRMALRFDNNAPTPINVASGNTPNGIDLLISAAITGAGIPVKSGAGTLLLAGTNSFSGGLTNQAGLVVIGNNTALGTGPVTMSGGAISNLTGSSFGLGNNINLASTTSVGVNTNDTLTLGGVINSTGGLTKVGNGTLALTGPNAYSGITTVGGGRLVVSAAQSGTGSIAVNDLTKFGVTAFGASHLSPTTLTVGSSTGASLEITASSTTQAPLTPVNLVLNGTSTINVVGGIFVAGNSYPLLTYTTLSGAGSLTAGTIPSGVVGTITQTGNTYYLNVTAVQNDVWTGAVNGTWDIATTANWLTNGVAGVYLDGANVQFDDTGLNTTTITNLGTVLSPGAITVNNTTKNYAIKTAIAGIGGITKSGTGWLTNSGANTYTGPTVINGGNVVAGVASVANVSGALGNNSAVSLANTADSALSLNGFATQIGSLTGGGTTGGNVTNGGALLTVGGDNTSPAAYAGIISGTGGLTKIGTGTLQLSGVEAYTGATTVSAGALTLSGSLLGATGAINVNPASGTTATLNLSGVITNSGAFTVGSVAGGTGIVNVNSATTFSPGTGTSALIIGNAGFGTYNQTGGTVTSGQYLVAGITTAGAVGIMNISGGTYSPKAGNNGGTLGATLNTTGQLNMTGTGNYVSADTTANGAAGLYVGENGAGTLNISGSATMTLGGATTSAGLDIGRANAAAIGIVNLGAVNAGGGTITTMRVGKNNTSATGTLNFHGGLLRAGVAANPTFMSGLTAAYDYSEGAVIDNNGQAITISQPILAPVGSGVTAIANNASGFVTTGYSTAPYVSIAGGSPATPGADATAVATIDGSGNLAAITVCNPGSYSDVSGITVTLSGGGKNTTSSTTAVATSANVSGGLTSMGGGSLTLEGANTYTGTTLAAGGTLILDSSIGWTPAGPVVVTNAALAVNASSGNPQAVGSLTLLNAATNTFIYGTVSANPTAPALNATSLSASGSGLVITVSAFGLQKGQFPLIQYGSLSGSFANFSLGDLPPGVVANLVNNTANSTIDINITSTGQNLAWYGLLPDGVNVSSNWDITVTTNWVSVGTTTPAVPYKQYTASGSTVGDPVTFDDTLYNDFINPQTTNVNLTTPVRPFRLLVDSTLPYSFSSSISITNGISGLESLVKSNTGSLTLLTSNTYSGGTIVGGGTLVITNDFALGAVSSPVTLVDSTLQINGNTTNNTRAFTVTTVSGTPSIGVLTNTVARIGGTLSSIGGLTKTDNGTLTLAGNDTISGTLNVELGTLNLSGSNYIGGALTVNQGIVNASGTNNLAAVPLIGNTTGFNAVLNITGGLFNDLNNPAQVYNSSLTIGNVAGAAGGVQMSAGALIIPKQLTVGSATYGAFSQSGGTTTIGGFIACGGTSSGGVLNQSGGIINQTNTSVTLGYSATTTFGVMNLSGTAVFNESGAGNGVWPGEVGNGTLNVSGSAVLNITNDGVVLGRANAAAVGTFNLNGGTVAVNFITNGVGHGTVNFNGGTLKARSATSSFSTGTAANMAFYDYNGGVVFDDGGFAVTLPQPILAPTGFGVATIPVTPSTSSGYIDTPIVTISGGTGSNAMATATVSGGQITSVSVTCPGTGYLNGDSLSVTFTGGGESPTPPTVGTITFVANGTGGFTKNGTGTLTLSGVNTFAGPITNNAGTLSLKTANTNSGASVNGGTLSVTTASKFTGGIIISNGASFTLAQVGSATNSPSSLTLNGGAAVPGATLGLGLTGLNPTVPLLTVGTLTINGTNTVSVAGAVNLGTIPLVKYSTFAGTGTYTNITLPQGVTGYITNISANSTLYVVITGTGPGLVWTGFNTNAAFTNLWNISATTNWLLGATPTTYQQPIIPGDAVTFNDSGSGTVIVNTNVGPSNLTISNNALRYTFSGIGTVSGSTGVKKLGTNIAILNLTNSSYSGDTVISNGTLLSGSASAISPSANLSVGPAGALDLAGSSATVNGLAGSGTINNSGANAVVLTLGNVNGPVNWSGTMTNTGTGGESFIKVGSGNSVITGTNYLASTAASQVNGGTMLITNGGALHMSGGAEFWVMQNAGTATVIVDGGTLDVANNWLVVGRNNVAAVGTLIVNSGLVNKAGANNIVVGSLGATGYLYVNGGQVLNSGNLWLGENTGANAYLYLNGGLIQATQVRANGTAPTTSIAQFNGGTLQASADSGDFIQTPVVANVMSNGLVLDDNGFTLSIGTTPLVFGDALNGGLIKKGSGTVYLDAANTYTGTTLVTNGTLAGIGSISGSLVVAPTGNLGAGDAAGVGTFTIGSTSNLTLQGNATLRIDNTIGLVVSNDQVLVSGNITYGGTLIVTNVTSDANPLTAGETFQLFSVTGSHAGNFTGIAGSPGAGLAYQFTPANGVLSIVTQPYVNYPTNVLFSVSGNQLTLSWPADHIGWILQAQTNALGAGLSGNWFDIPNTSSIGTNVITINPADPTVFYRLRKP